MVNEEIPGLGVWMRDWRHQNRWTQEQLAEALGYEVSYVAKIERGVRPPSRQVLARLAEIVAIPREELTGLARRPSSKVRLPTPGGSLVGRASEVAEIGEQVLKATRCLTLVGAPGIGKTSLALEAAWEVAPAFRHGVCFVALADVGNPVEVAAALVQALGLVEQRSVDLEQLALDALRNREMLLVFDNFEHVLDAGGTIDRLLGSAPGIRILITSREALNVVGETLYHVRPLAFPSSSEALDRHAADHPAVQLFVERARREAPEFELTETNVGAVTEICARLDGLPLGITLTAAAIRILSPADIARSLRDRLELPTVGASDPFARRLTAAMDWSWNLLTPPEQALLACLAVFAGSFTLEAVEAVCSDLGAGADVLEGLASLEGKHLIEVTGRGSGPSRFALLETIKRYAHERLRERNAVGELEARHCAYFLAVAREAEPHLTGGPAQPLRLRLIADDYPNFAAAYHWALTEDPETAMELSMRLWRFFLLRRTSEGRRWLDQALANAAGDPLLRMRALNASAFLARTQGYFDEALDSLARLRVHAGEVGSTDDDVTREMALATLNLGIVEQERGFYDVAESHFNDALALYRRCGDDRGVGHAVNCLGVIALRRDQLEAATRLFYSALTVFRRLDDAWSIAVTATNLGWIAEVQGELAEAKAWYEESRHRWDSVGDEHGAARALAGLGRVARRRGDASAGRAFLERALAELHRLGSPRLAAACLVELAALALRRRRRELAARLVGAAQGIRDDLGAPAWPVEGTLEIETLSALRETMGDGALDRALRMGRGLSLEDALALVEAGTWPPSRNVSLGERAPEFGGLVRRNPSTPNVWP